jgi:hypothetical protein
MAQRSRRGDALKFKSFWIPGYVFLANSGIRRPNDGKIRIYVTESQSRAGAPKRTSERQGALCFLAPSSQFRCTIKAGDIIPSNCRPVDANGHCFVPTPKNQPSLDLLTSAAVLREFCCHLCFLALLLRFVFAHFFILPSIRRRRHP